MKRSFFFSALLTLILAMLAWSCEKDIADEMVSPTAKMAVGERCDCPACPEGFLLIDFEGETPETFISSVMTSAGAVGIRGLNPKYPDFEDALVFDSGDAPSWDNDLATPGYNNTADLGNILIVSDNPASADRPKFYNDEDYRNTGVLIEFDFANIGPVTVFSIDYLDMEDNNSPSVKLYDENNVLLNSFPVSNLGDNSYQRIVMEVSGVYRMEAILGGSGGVDNLCIQPEYEDEGCTHTLGYWKTHSVYGPATPADPAWNELPDGADTPFFGTGYSYYEMLKMKPAKGNAYIILAHQWIAAYLNVLSGASIPPDVLTTWLTGQDILIMFEDDVSIPKNSPYRSQAIDLAEMLDDYNNGELGPPHCED